jgi:hypothetical protein
MKKKLNANIELSLLSNIFIVIVWLVYVVVQMFFMFY